MGFMEFFWDLSGQVYENFSSDLPLVLEKFPIRRTL